METQLKVDKLCPYKLYYGLKNYLIRELEAENFVVTFLILSLVHSLSHLKLSSSLKTSFCFSVIILQITSIPEPFLILCQKWGMFILSS